MFLTDLAVQILDREQSRPHRRTQTTTVRTAPKHQLGGKVEEVGEIYCRKGVGILLEQVIRTIQDF